jgi:lipoyl(octanoyl) transferase
MIAHLRRLGLVEYEDALRMQAALVEARQQDRVPDQVLLVEHPHSYTLGRRAKREHILIDEAAQRRWGVQVFESVRGGDVTYHGPGQIVLYPILALPPSRHDLVRYVRDLEEVMIRTLAVFGVTAGRIEGLSGTWVGDEKIGAIGVRMSRWVCSHGLALNVNTDLRYFEMIVACGIRDHGVTSLSALLGRPVDLEEVRAVLLIQLVAVFGLELEERPVDLESIQTIVYRQAVGARSGGLELLCLRRVPAKGGYWQSVTGRIEPGETPAEAALREVQEETGLTGVIEPLDYVHQFMLEPAFFPDLPVPYFVEEHAFAMAVDPEAGVRLEAESHDAFEWLPAEEAMGRVKWPGNREAMRRLAERGRRPAPYRPASPLKVRRVTS